MSERKNIDRLFQEKFKDFEVNAPEGAWMNIEAKLDDKKKRRVIPFWWKLSGVAAVFLLGFLISKSIYDGNRLQTENPIVNENNSNPKKETGIKDVHVKTIKENIIPTDPSLNEQAKQNQIVNQSNTDKSNRNSSEGLNNLNQKNTAVHKAVAESSNKTKGNPASEEKNAVQKPIYSSKSAMAERKASHHRSLKNSSNPEKNKASATNSGFEKSENPIAQNSKNNDSKESKAEKNIAQNDSKAHIGFVRF